MPIPRAGEPRSRKPIRLWPGMLLAVLLCLVKFGLPLIAPEAAQIAMMGGALLGVAIIIWWAFFSRAPRFERWGAVGLMIIALIATSRLVHVSIATAMMGMMFPAYAIPVLSLAFVAWAAAGRRLSPGPRRAAMVATILIACGAWTLVRTGGFTGGLGQDFTWRWAKTPEERLLAQAGDEPVAPPAAAAAAETRAEWPGFRGPGRDGLVRGVRIRTDWSASPPAELWRRPVGPGWSSFAVQGDFFYTQEQRGGDELVSCYQLASGRPAWRHRDAARFWEANAGPGPRGTPTLDRGRVYTFGGTGILNALDAGTGSVVWTRNAATDTGTVVPQWGFSSSLLVVGDVVIAAAAGRLAAYDRTTGERRWLGPDGGAGYSSPRLVTIDGVPQVLLMGGAGAVSAAPSDGTVLWNFPWTGVPIVQPAQVTGGDVLITTANAMGGIGIRRLAVANGPGGWTVKDRWLSDGLRPYFNDFVIHKGYAFGFDGRILACIDLESGASRWRGGRYGNGQLVLLPDQDLLLVLSEKGELVLVEATPNRFLELARFPAITGKTWNHPVLVGDILLVRNGQEMAAFRLSLDSR